MSHPLQSVTVTASLQSFQILNNQSGWLLTQHALYHLTHGGRNATRVQASANGPLVATWFHGKVYTATGLGQNQHDGIKIQSSTNGGRSWVSLGTIHSPYLPMQLIMHSTGTGWLETSPGAGGAEMPAQLWKTVNAGRHWTLVAQFPLQKDIVNGQPRVLIQGGRFHFLARNHGWLIPFPSPSAYQTFLYRTTTGGQTWRPVKWPWPVGRTATEAIGIAALTTNTAGTGLVMIQWGSKTGGWQAASLVNNRFHAWGPLITGGSNPVFTTTTSPTAIGMAAQQTLWVMSTNAALQPVVRRVTTRLPFTSAMALQLSGRKGWALSRSHDNHPVLWTTTDGGVHWHRVS